VVVGFFFNCLVTSRIMLRGGCGQFCTYLVTSRKILRDGHIVGATFDDFHQPTLLPCVNVVTVRFHCNNVGNDCH